MQTAQPDLLLLFGLFLTHLNPYLKVLFITQLTLPTAEILSSKNVWAWVSMVLYFKK